MSVVILSHFRNISERVFWELMHLKMESPGTGSILGCMIQTVIDYQVGFPVGILVRFPIRNLKQLRFSKLKFKVTILF
jgi:hypothetical protein